MVSCKSDLLVVLGAMSATTVETAFTVETQRATFDSLALDCGVTLKDVNVAYETYGELNADAFKRHPGSARLQRRCPRCRRPCPDRFNRLVVLHDRTRPDV